MSITIQAECDQGLFFQGHKGICQCESCPSKQFRKHLEATMLQSNRSWSFLQKNLVTGTEDDFASWIF